MTINVRNFRNLRQLKKANGYSVFLNGVDVSGRTFYVDGRRRVARLLLLDDEGNSYVSQSGHEAAWEERRGNVKLQRRAV